MIRVLSVAPDSIGDDLGLTPGTELLAVNGRELSDFLDWEFLTADDQFEVETRLPNGDSVVFDIERPEGYPMGLEIEPPRIRRCGNRCDFCFVDGLPTGLRQNLYVRDDDYRLSFRHGNFATLTNLKDSDVRRILEYRLSPLYVSVHATDPVTRRRLLRNPRAPAIVEQLQMFAEGGLQFHTQIVLQPGLNDGPVLVQSLNDLYAMGDPILSVSVVPVGLTEFSKHRLVRESSSEESRRAVETVGSFQIRSLDERGERWVFGSDELYIRAQLPLPEYDTYGNFEQAENGVGSVRFLQGIIDDAAPQLPNLEGQHIAVVTGVAMGQLMPLITSLLEEHTRASFDVVVVENDLFGPRVTTAGLLSGESMLRSLEHCQDLDMVLLPAESLNDDHRFIDDMPLETLVTAVSADVRCSYDFADVLRREAS